MRRAPTALLVVVAAALLAPAVASAHAVLEGSSPSRSEVVRTQPSQVVLRFDEPVEAGVGGMRVFDAHGRRVDRGGTFHPGGVSSRVAVRLRDGLAKGTYVATYRIISADGHVVSGGSDFSIGRASARAPSVAGLLAGERTGPVTPAAFAVARALQFAAIAVGAGALAFLLLCGSAVAGAAREALRRRVRLLLSFAATAGVVSAAAMIVLESAEIEGRSAWDSLGSDALSGVLGTRFGTVWAIAVGCWLAVSALGARTVAVLPLAALVLAPAVGGHGATQSPIGVTLPSTIVHVAAMSVWVGGLVALVACLPAATRTLAAEERGGVLHGVLARFSATALWAVAALLATGLVQAYVEVRRPSALVETGFGRAVLIKLVLLLTLIGIGALHRLRLLPRLREAVAAGRTPGRTGVAILRALRTEVALVAAALATTGALAGYAPAVTAASGPVDRTVRIGGAEVQLVVDPASVGANEIHLYLTRPGSGAPFTGLEQLTLTASRAEAGIGPLELPTSPAGPGHYLVTRALLTSKGDWDVRITIRVSAFDELQKDVEVPVR